MEIRPCLTGSEVWAAAAAMGALPRPASLEKIPRAIPFCIATRMAPRAPPAAARIPKADCTISTTAAGTAVILNKITNSAETTYRIAINGTMISATLEILFNPPMITRPTQRVRRIPVMTTVQEYVLPNKETLHALLGSKKLFTALEIPFTCVNVPMPKRPTPTPKNANTFASHFQFLPIPFSM